MAVTSAHAPGAIVGIISAAIICATMSSADSNLLCMSTMLMNDLYLKYGGNSLRISRLSPTPYLQRCGSNHCHDHLMAGIPIVTMNTFAFGIRCAGPLHAYGLGPASSPKATKNSGILSLIGGTIGFCFWQYLSGGGFKFGILPVVFGCAVSVAVFFLVNAIEWSRGVEPAPSAYMDEK